MKAIFAIPGDLQTHSGGYAYARRLLREGPGIGLDLEVQVLPDGFPHPDYRALADAGVVLSRLPTDQVLLIDGLAYGAFSDQVLAQIQSPVVALCHHPLSCETGLSEYRADELLKSERMALARADHVITTSHATAEILTRIYGVAGARLTVAQPGTDPADRAAGSGGPDCHILSVGSITPRKGHDKLVAALAGLRDLDWRLTIAGHAPEQEQLANLDKLISRLGLSERISLAGGMTEEELNAAYNSADLFVLASEYEGFGMAFTEAMARGLPVVGLPSDAVEEATQGAALLVDAQDLEGILRALIEVPSERQELAQKCWIVGQTMMRWPQTAAIVASVIRQVGE
ncbi:MAG: glycosyltransferase family 4 protein [Pseudomonadota bacterium]